MAEVVKLVIHSARFSRFFSSQKPTKDNSSKKFNLTLGLQHTENRQQMFHYRFLQGSIKCKIPFPTIKCFLVKKKSTAVHFFFSLFFLKLGTPLNSFTRILALLLPRSNISLDRKKSQFSTYLHENGVQRAKLIVELRGLKTLVDLGEQQADNSPKPSAAATTILVVWSKYRQDLLARRPNKAHQSSTKIHR